jgi:hypothetical protein
MPTSQARILANQANSKLSTGPKTPEGKAQSRANSYKHGLTGAGVVMPRADADEVDRRAASFAAETNASGDIGHALARRAALGSVRMERAADQQAAALSEHVRRVDAEFVAPEGVDEARAAELRDEATRRAMFDPSREAALARQYEAAAERSFFRALKELRVLEKKQAKVAQPAMDEQAFLKVLASFSQTNQQIDRKLDEMEAKYPESAPTPASKPQKRIEPGYLASIDDIFDVPIAIGKRR